MKFLLRLKHWHLFILMIGLPLAWNILISVSAITDVSGTTPLLVYSFPLLMIFFSVFYFGWLYALGNNLYSMVPVGVKLKINLFRAFLIIPFAYIIILSLAMSGIMHGAMSGNPPGPMIFVVIMAMHLFSMFCIFYCIYFVARALKAIEWQKPVAFSDFAGEFFLLWFFPVGLWILQPRINKLFGSVTPKNNF